MLDPDLPLELDDGTPVELVEYAEEWTEEWDAEFHGEMNGIDEEDFEGEYYPGTVTVTVPRGSSVFRHRDDYSGKWTYNLDSGELQGHEGSDVKLLQNVDEDELYAEDIE